MTPPNYFRFVTKTYVDPGPTEASPNYVTFNNQYFHRPSSGYTYDISNFTIGDTGSFTGDLDYHSNASHRRTFYLEANGASNSYDLRSGSIVWEMQPDAQNGKQSATSELDDQGWDTRIEWRYYAKRLSDNSFFNRFIQYDPSNYNGSPAYYERWDLQPDATSAGWAAMNFEVSNNVIYKPSDFQFRWMLSYANVAQTRLKLRVMHRHTASAVSWDDLMSKDDYANNEYFARDTGTYDMTFNSEDSYKFYPSFQMFADANPGSGVDVAVKYFKVWYGEHHNSE